VKELALATTVLRQQARQAHHTAAITALRLAEFLADVQAHEHVLLQRLRDLESRAVLEALASSGGERTGTATAQGPAPPAVPCPPVDLATIPAFEEYHL
jgi:putative transposase